jgi:hypothetical protein
MPPGHDGMDLLYERHSGPILLAYRGFATNTEVGHGRHEPAMSVHGT